MTDKYLVGIYHFSFFVTKFFATFNKIAIYSKTKFFDAL